MKIGIVTSKGGHLYQLLQLKNFYKRHNRFWITFAGEDVTYYLADEKKYFANYPESRNLINALKNFLLAVKILRKEKPDYLISTGAGIAVPFYIIGKLLFQTKLIFIETYDFVAYPSLTGKIVYNFVDLFLIQYKFQKKWFPKAKYWGKIL